MRLNQGVHNLICKHFQGSKSRTQPGLSFELTILIPMGTLNDSVKAVLGLWLASSQLPEKKELLSTYVCDGD